MFEHLVQRTTLWARTPSGLGALFVASLLETTVVPIPFEAVMVPMMLADRARLWLIATIAFFGCLAGALLGYAVGALVFETAGRWLLSSLDAMEAFRSFQAGVDQNGFWLIVAIGITPVPFQVGTVGSGVVGYSIAWFVLAILLSRGIRYYGLAVLTWQFGDRVEESLRRYSAATRVGVLVILAGVVIYGVIRLL